MSNHDAVQASAAASRSAAVEELALQDSDTGVWKAQDAALSRLPEALVSAFTRTEQDFYRHSKVTDSPRAVASQRPNSARHHSLQ